jgi:hypothetical protein
MPNLFPIETVTATPEETQASQVKFGRSWRFDFDAGEFAMTPTGGIAESRGTDAWLEWCKKALMTARYRYLVYSRAYGQEFDDLISRHLTRAGNESEIKRIATECLMVDPRTAAVENFTFEWEGDAVYFTCEVSNVLDESGTVGGSVVIS